MYDYMASITSFFVKNPIMRTTVTLCSCLMKLLKNKTVKLPRLAKVANYNLNAKFETDKFCFMKSITVVICNFFFSLFVFLSVWFSFVFVFIFSVFGLFVCLCNCL